MSPITVPPMGICRVLPLLLLLSLGGCAGGVGAKSDETRQWLLSGAALPERPPEAPEVTVVDVMSLDTSMQRFAEQAVAGLNSDRGKVRALLQAVIGPAGLNLLYDPTASYTAKETYVRRRANCLSFTLMMVAMLRHVGVNAQFNDVDVPLIWDIRNERTLIFYKHINAIVELSLDGRVVVDLNMDEYDTTFEQRVISDQAAAAQYFNNRAMEFLQQGDAIRAFPYLARAIELEPKQSYVWNNLGSLYERAGNLHAARLAFEVALSERRGDLVAMSNASRVYQALGDTARADDLARRVATFRLSNPYFRYLQAMDAFRQQDYQKARDEVAAAIRLYRPEHRFHFLLGAIYERLGLHEQARASMREALTLTRDEKQIARYRDKMERLFAMQM